MIDPDFLPRAVDNSNRFESAKYDVDSYNYETRLLEKKKAFWAETIHLKLVHQTNDGQRQAHQDAPTTTTWKIPRFRLTREMLEDACNRANIAFAKDKVEPAPSQESKLVLSDKVFDKGQKIIPLMLSHLHHPETNTVILPDQMQSQCKPSMKYLIVVRAAGSITSGGVLSGSSLRRTRLQQQLGNNHAGVQTHYDGSLCFVLHNVPRTSQNKQFMVTSNDIRRWLVEGCTKDDHSMTVPNKRLADLKQALEKLERERRSLVAMESPLHLIEEEIDSIQADIEEAQYDINEARDTHFENCILSISRLPSKTKDETFTSWKVAVRGRNKEKYQRLIEKNRKWCLVPLYAFGEPEEETKRKSKPKQKNDDDFVSSVSKSDQANHFVDVGRVQIEKLPDGFGVYESYKAVSISSSADGDVEGHHRLYHGHFKEGEMNGNGSLYTDEGIYSGDFKAGERVGYGTMEYSDNITLTGDFALSGGEVRGNCSRVNPYSKGLPHGHVHITFENGDEYEGEMNIGNLSGRGTYRYAIER